jgi:hypothetical protein
MKLFKALDEDNLDYDNIKDDVREAGIYDVCEWWIETYPDNIFVNEPKDVIQIRELMKKILKLRR